MRDGRGRVPVWVSVQVLRSQCFPTPCPDQSCHTWASSYTLNSQWQHLGQGEAPQSVVLLARLCGPQCLSARWGGAAVSPRGGGNPEQSAPNPRLGLRREMAAAEPGSSGTPARRARLPAASPVQPRDCDPGGLAQPSESWGLRAPGASSPARLWETVPTQVRPGVGGRRKVHLVGGPGRGKGTSGVCQRAVLTLWEQQHPITENSGCREAGIKLSGRGLSSYGRLSMEKLLQERGRGGPRSIDSWWTVGESRNKVCGFWKMWRMEKGGDPKVRGQL